MSSALRAPSATVFSGPSTALRSSLSTRSWHQATIVPSQSVRPVRAGGCETAASRADVLTTPQLTTNPGATVGRFTVRDRITASGFDLVEPWSSLVRGWRDAALTGARGSRLDVDDGAILTRLEEQ